MQANYPAQYPAYLTRQESWIRVARWSAGEVLIAHGLIHLLGWSATWGIGGPSALASTPALVPGLVAGSPPVLLLGVMWLLLSATFILAGIGVATASPGWRSVATVAALCSLGICLLWWGEVLAIAVIDVAILGCLGLYAVVRPQELD